MKFVIPAAEDEEAAEHLYGAIRKFAILQTRLRLTERRVLSIDYVADGVRHFAEVGKTHLNLGEQVYAILEAESKSYLLCSPNRCVYRNEPMFIESRMVRRVIYFEDESLSEPIE